MSNSGRVFSLERLIPPAVRTFASGEVAVDIIRRSKLHEAYLGSIYSEVAVSLYHLTESPSWFEVR